MKTLLTIACLVSLGATGMVLATESPGEVAAFQDVKPGTLSLTAGGRVIVPVQKLAVKVIIKVSEDTAAEAVDSFKQSRSKALQALEGAELEGLTITGLGLVISHGMDQEAQQQQMMFGGMEQPEATVNCKEELIVSFDAGPDEAAQRDQISAIVDSALDAGLKFAGGMPNPYYYNQGNSTPGEDDGLDQPGMVSGRVNPADVAAHRRAAHKDALDSARADAQVIAELSGRALGQVRSINVQSSGTKWLGIGRGREYTA